MYSVPHLGSHLSTVCMQEKYDHEPKEEPHLIHISRLTHRPPNQEAGVGGVNDRDYGRLLH